MNHTTKISQRWGTLVALVFVLILAGLMAAGCNSVEPLLVKAPVEAYPQPPEPMADATAYPLPLGPTSSPPTLVPTDTPGPPPDWPTDLPWPPWEITPPTPLPTATPQPFPTPAFLSAPTGNRPDILQNLWFPYYPDPGSDPEMRVVEIDAQGQRWGQSGHTIPNLVIPRNRSGPGARPTLADFHLSPNNRWLVVDVTFWEPQVVDLLSKTAGPLLTDSLTKQWSFLTWHPDGQRILVASRDGFQFVNMHSNELEKKDLVLYRSEHVQLKDIAYSPDGVQLADAVAYPPVKDGRSIWMLEIGLQDEDNARSIIAQIEYSGSVTSRSLRWSTDGSRLIWIAHVVTGELSSEDQLWMADLVSGDVKILGVLGQSVQYWHPAVWSSDGQLIAALKVENDRENKEMANNIYLLNPETGDEQQLTFFPNGQLSHLQWSPDGQCLAFTVSMGDYGEIWVTNIDGSQQFPVAGPTMHNAPFVWLP